MSRKRLPGLYRQNGVWHVDKRIKGYGRLCESCGTRDLDEAERFLIHRLEEIRQAEVYGIRPTRTFEEAARKYLEENDHKRSLRRDVDALKQVLPFIGHMPLDRVHNDSLAEFKRARRQAGRAAGTINKELGVIRRILNLAGRVWRHENGMTWLSAPPLLEMAKGPARRPYPLSWDEQSRLFQELPPHLERVALFAVNTGCRSGEVRRLEWDWEVAVPEVDDTVFIIPDTVAKNGQERIVVLNTIARRVVEGERGKHSVHVFTYQGRSVQKVNTHAFRRARDRARIPEVRFHDLRHTFGHRLRAAGVSFEDRQDLLGHKSDRMTTHYSAPDLVRLIESANRVCERRPSTVLRVAKGAGSGDSRKTPVSSVP